LQFLQAAQLGGGPGQLVMHAAVSIEIIILRLSL
jgi:hypothetical protein